MNNIYNFDTEIIITIVVTTLVLFQYNIYYEFHKNIKLLQNNNNFITNFNVYLS